MTAVPADLSAVELCRRLARLGYRFDRQSGSHMTYTTLLNGENHAYIPKHNPIKRGTLRKILKDIAAHHDLTIEALLQKLGI